MRTNLTIITAIALSASIAVAQPHGHEGDLTIGRTAAGQLIVDPAFDFDGVFILPAFDGGGLAGWLGDEPGFTGLDADEPDEGIFTLAAGADVRIMLTAVSTGLNVWDPPFSGIVNPAGGMFALDLDGVLDGEFDTHPFWHVDSGLVGTSPGDAARWDVSFKLVDAGATVYSDSPVYTLTFAVPALGAAALAGLAGVVAVRRRR